MSDFEVFNAGETSLQSGATLPDARIAHKIFGRLNQARDNAVVFPTAYMGDHTFNEWLIQPSKALSPDDYFVIVPNMLGNGLSSSPSNTASPLDDSAFPLVTHYDNVRLQTLFFALIYNKAGVPIAACVLFPFFGILISPMFAAFAMSASSISVALNSLRLRSTKV